MQLKDFTLKNVKTFSGMEGNGVNADLYFNGKKIGMIINEGSGGPTMIRSLTTETNSILKQFYKSEDAKKLEKKSEKEFQEFASTLSNNEPVKYHTPIGEIFADHMIGEFEYIKKVKKLINKYGVVFRYADDHEDDIRYFKGRTPSKEDCVALVSELKTKHNGIVILNEEYNIYPS